MNKKYAKDQPAGFSNRIERVAIVGASGHVGSHIAAELISGGKHTVTAITRSGSGSKMPEGAKVVAVDYDKPETIVEALRGQQFLIISLSVQAPADSQTKLIQAAADAGVGWVMPNCYGSDFRNVSLATENLTGAGVLAGIEAVEKSGLSWVALCCSFWYEWSLSIGPAAYGFDLAEKKVTLFDDGKTLINMSTWEQCGRALKSLLGLKELPDDEADSSPTLSRWRNQPLYISSFLASQRDLLDSLHRVTGTSDADWQIDNEDSKARYERGRELLKQGQQVGFVQALYSRTFYPNGDGNFEAKHGLANEVLRLPKESMDDATKRALGLPRLF